eukprot:170494_1
MSNLLFTQNTIDKIDKESKYIVFGFLRESQTLLIPIIPRLIAHVILSYYYIDIQWDLYNETQFEIDNHKTKRIVKGITDQLYEMNCYSYEKSYMIYPTVSSIKETNNALIQKWSVKAIRCYYERCHSIGVTTERNIKGWFHGAWHHGGEYSFLDGRFTPSDGVYWKRGETVTVVLNCVLWMVTYYKTDKKRKYKIIKVKEERISPNKTYYFAMCAHPGAAYIGVAEYQIVETPHDL